MSDLPSHVNIHEEGPREGFQIEPGPISTADKIRLIEALGETGLKHIQVCSFVNQRLVPGWADAEAVVAGFKATPGITYTGLWFNANGLERALAFRDKLTIRGAIALTASEGFTRKNLNRSHAENVAAMRKQTALHLEKGVPVKRIGVMAAFGCNYEGDVEPKHVVTVLQKVEQKANACGSRLGGISLADTMGWANPLQIKRLVGTVRDRWPSTPIKLHLHDTRALAVANVLAAMEVGIDYFDTAVAGMGGCPFAAHKGAAGNVTTEDVVFLCQELGVETGIDLDKMIEAGQLAERVVGHPLPGKLKSVGNLQTYRARARAGAAA